MRLVSYRASDAVRGGIVVNGTVYDLARVIAASPEAAQGAVTSVREFLELHGSFLGERAVSLPKVAVETADARVGEVGDVPLTGPVTDPSKVLCIGLNYKDHVAETGRALPEHPDLFAKFASTLIGPNDGIRGSEITENLDFEGELAIVIGKSATNVTAEDALDHVAGVAPLNDITARDLQYRGTQWLAGKSVDASTPWGPELVTLDEVGDVQTLDLVTRVNGVEMQRSNTRHQIFTVREVVSYLSKFLTLSPGDVIATGTPQGIGAKRTPPVWLRPGDRVEVEISRVGLLANTVR